MTDTATFTPTPGNPFQLEDLHPMRDRILVRPLAVTSRSLGGLHLPEMSHQRERPMHGIVVRTGPGAYNRERDTLIPLQVKVGDCVFYGKYSGQEFTIAGLSVLNMGEIEVFSVLPAGTFVVVEHEDVKLNHLQGDYCDLCATPEELAAKQALEDERARLQTERIHAAIKAGAPVQGLEIPDAEAIKNAAASRAYAEAEAEDAAQPGQTESPRSFLEEERERLRLQRAAAEEPAS